MKLSIQTFAFLILAYSVHAQSGTNAPAPQNDLLSFAIGGALFLGFSIIFIPAAILFLKHRAKHLRLKNELDKDKTNMALKEVEYKSKMNDIAFTALRAQMNSHFIFNCLNSIKLYIEQNDSATASEYLSRFSRLIRGALDFASEEYISLSKELEMLGLYLEMEALRFKNKLSYTISVARRIDEDLIEIPPLLIQPYVENAIWHGLMHRDEGGIIHIDISQSADHSFLLISVTDNGIGREKSTAINSRSTVHHKSFGTKATLERIALINEKYKIDAQALITDLRNSNNEPAGTLVTIKLPIK